MNVKVHFHNKQCIRQSSAWMVKSWSIPVNANFVGRKETTHHNNVKSGLSSDLLLREEKRSTGTADPHRRPWGTKTRNWCLWTWKNSEIIALMSVSWKFQSMDFIQQNTLQLHQNKDGGKCYGSVLQNDSEEGSHIQWQLATTQRNKTNRIYG